MKTNITIAVPEQNVIYLHVMDYEFDQKISVTKLSRPKHIPACRSVFIIRGKIKRGASKMIEVVRN